MIQNYGGYTVVSATTQVTTRPAVLLGILVATTSAGTFTVYDSAAATTTTPVTGTITPAAATWLPLNACLTNGIYIVTSGTITLTAVYS